MRYRYKKGEKVKMRVDAIINKRLGIDGKIVEIAGLKFGRYIIKPYVIVVTEMMIEGRVVKSITHRL